MLFTHFSEIDSPKITSPGGVGDLSVVPPPLARGDSPDDVTSNSGRQ